MSTANCDVYDVVIVGAGISGINTAYRLQSELPGITYTILDARAAIGGTWDFFKYPGLRSDSDLFTFGFQWRPWSEKRAVADGQSILSYIRASATAEGIDRRIHFNSRVQTADWSSKSQNWTLTVNSNNTIKQVLTKFLVFGSGYYDYEQALPAVIPGLSSFNGRIIHPQFWPDDLDYTDKRIVVIGSGATAVTLLPTLAQKAAIVTMLQRSPTYILALPNPASGSLLQKFLPEYLSFKLSRIYFLVLPMMFYYFCRIFPKAAKNFLRNGAASHLPKGYPVDPDFTPSYKPFDQRVCFAPDGDFYAAIRNGRAKVMTGTIKNVVDDSIVLNNGQKIDADIIVTATGLKLRWGGGVKMSVDKQPYLAGDKFTWNHAMLQDLPNCAFVIGYSNASWTLGADATALLLCRILKGVHKHGLTSIIPRIPNEPMKAIPILSLNSTYVRAAREDMPRAGDVGPWRRRTTYFNDMFKVKYCNVTQDLETYQGDTLVTGITF